MTTYKLFTVSRITCYNLQSYKQYLVLLTQTDHCR